LEAVARRGLGAVLLGYSTRFLTTETDYGMSSSPNRKKLDNKDEEAIISEICDYATKFEIKELLEDYMRRLIVEQPKDPLKFLVKEITENPYKRSDEKEAASEESASAP
jgi:hypothetical protein